MTEKRLPRVAKGKRPTFFDDPAVDQVMSIVTAMAGEISILYDRIDSLERVLAANGIDAPTQVEAYVPPPDIDADRQARRMAMLDRLFRVIREEADTFSNAEAEAEVADVGRKADVG